MQSIQVPSEALVPVLARARYFAELSPELLGRIVPAVRAFRAVPGEDIVRINEPGDAMYMIVSGKAEVVIEDKTTGADNVLAVMEAGACFGELACVRQSPRAATVRALGQVDLAAISASDFRELLTRLPSVALAVIDTLSEWLTDNTQKFGTRFVNLRRFPYDVDVVKSFDANRARTLKALPLRRDGDRVTVAMVEPSNVLAVDEMRRACQATRLEVVACSGPELDAFLSEVVGKHQREDDPWANSY